MRLSPWWVPTSRTRRWVPPPPGGKPSRISGWPITWSPSAMRRKSQASASSDPMPRADPLSAATKTAPQRFIRRNVSCTSRSSIAPLSGVRSASFRTPATARVARAVWTTAGAPRGPALRLAATPPRPDARSRGAPLLQPAQVGVRDESLGMGARDHDRADGFVRLCAGDERGEVRGDLGSELPARPAVELGEKHASLLLDLDSEAVVLGDGRHGSGTVPG